MSLNGTSGTTYTPPSTSQVGTLGAGSGTSGATATNSNSALGQNAFLQLMMTQLKDQDPLNPSDPTQYLSELAQMTSVEQQTNTAQSVAQAATAQTASTALSLLGHTVSYQDANGNTLTGAVSKVDFTSSGPSLTIDGTAGISPSAVTEVS
jgi:flagellar basal-body rod modification protein FlgD